MHLHVSSFVWNAAQTTSWSGLSDRIYITKSMKRPGVNNHIYIFMLYFIKIKLSSRLYLTQKREYRNSTLIKKKIRSELSDNPNVLDRIWKKLYRFIPITAVLYIAGTGPSYFPHHHPCDKKALSTPS